MVNPPTGSISISFDEIFGSNPENITLDKLEEIVSQVVSETIQNTNRDPNELVRIVEDGKISFLTYEEAERILNSKEKNLKDNLQKNLQNAIRGDSKTLAQEMRVLIAIAQGTVNKYRESHLIPEPELLRTEPQIMRIGRQIINILNQLIEIEQKIRAIRGKNPLMATFEKKISELLVLQKQGEHDAALLLAKEIAGLKIRYLRLSKTLDSDQRQSQFVRLDIQHQKKMILNMQRYLTAQRVGVLQEALEDTRKTINNIKAVLVKSSSDDKDRYSKVLNHHETIAVKSSKELTTLEKEKNILEIQEKETDLVITCVEKTLKKDQERAAPSAPTAVKAPPPVPQEPVESIQEVRVEDKSGKSKVFVSKGRR